MRGGSRARRPPTAPPPQPQPTLVVTARTRGASRPWWRRAANSSRRGCRPLSRRRGRSPNPGPSFISVSAHCVSIVTSPPSPPPPTTHHRHQQLPRSTRAGNVGAVHVRTARRASRRCPRLRGRGVGERREAAIAAPRADRRGGLREGYDRPHALPGLCMPSDWGRSALKRRGTRRETPRPARVRQNGRGRTIGRLAGAWDATGPSHELDRHYTQRVAARRLSTHADPGKGFTQR
mmetsp:Transcript_88887/g.254109  ORF Transcript_88887/g.254109 Transcript_88887/m.254109 type:complete len:235 (-) Transcript_88887:961-1665(-)